MSGLLTLLLLVGPVAIAAAEPAVPARTARQLRWITRPTQRIQARPAVPETPAAVRPVPAGAARNVFAVRAAIDRGDSVIERDASWVDVPALETGFSFHPKWMLKVARYPTGGRGVSLVGTF